MTADAVLPLVTAEWQTTTAIGAALYEAEGRRGTPTSAHRRAWRGLKRLAEAGRVERVRGDGNSYVWRVVAA